MSITVRAWQRNCRQYVGTDQGVKFTQQLKRERDNHEKSARLFSNYWQVQAGEQVGKWAVGNGRSHSWKLLDGCPRSISQYRSPWWKSGFVGPWNGM